MHFSFCCLLHLRHHTVPPTCIFFQNKAVIPIIILVDGREEARCLVHCRFSFFNFFITFRQKSTSHVVFMLLWSLLRFWLIPAVPKHRDAFINLAVFLPNPFGNPHSHEKPPPLT